MAEESRILRDEFGAGRTRHEIVRAGRTGSGLFVSWCGARCGSWVVVAGRVAGSIKRRGDIPECALAQMAGPLEGRGAALSCCYCCRCSKLTRRRHCPVRCSTFLRELTLMECAMELERLDFIKQFVRVCQKSYGRGV